MSQGYEISVKQAARKIACTERTILNFIKMKRFQAIKVGRDWYIDYASFVSFAKRYKYPLKEDEEPEPTPTSITEPAPVLEKEKKDSSPKSSHLGQEPLAQERRRIQNIHSLRVFEMSRQILTSGRFEESARKTLRTRKENRALLLREKVLEEIGAGFYAYGFEFKRAHYARARARLGSILALLRSTQSLAESWSGEVEAIEGRLLPAFGALIRKMEKKSRQSRYESERED